MKEQEIARKRAADKEEARTRTTCIHFTGISFSGTDRGKCKAGVPYGQFADSNGNLFGNMPCINMAIDTCPMRELPTEEQVKLERQRIEKGMENLDNFAKAHKAAKDHAKHQGLIRGNGGRGSLPCPICLTGTLRYSVAGLNGHMHAACTTNDCMRWME